MIAFAERRVDIYTTSRKLQDLILSDMPIRLMPEEQQVVIENDTGQI